MTRQLNKGYAVILIAKGFEEIATIRSLQKFRGKGVKVDLVGPTASAVTGEYGIRISPDLSLGSIAEDMNPNLVLIPGGRESAETLLVDPRIHRLFLVGAVANFQLAVLKSAESAFTATGMVDLLSSPHVVTQREEEFDAFIEGLIDIA